MRTFFLKTTFKLFVVHLQTTDWQSLCSGGRHTGRLQDALSSVMVGETRWGDVSFPKIILRPHFKKEKPKAFGGVRMKVGGRRKMQKGEDGAGSGGGDNAAPAS